MNYIKASNKDTIIIINNSNTIILIFIYIFFILIELNTKGSLGEWKYLLISSVELCRIILLIEFVLS